MDFSFFNWGHSGFEKSRNLIFTKVVQFVHFCSVVLLRPQFISLHVPALRGVWLPQRVQPIPVVQHQYQAKHQNDPGRQRTRVQRGHVVDLHARLEDFGTVQLPQEPLSVHIKVGLEDLGTLDTSCHDYFAFLFFCQVSPREHMVNDQHNVDHNQNNTITSPIPPIDEISNH